MKKKQKWIIGGVALIVVLATGAWFARGAEADDASPYRTGEIEMGSVESTVTSTGRVTAIQSVAVGTQVSGQVTELYADYNDRVRRGQLIARIDPTLQQQALRNAEANLQRVRAALEQARRDFTRNRTLFEGQIITQAEFDQAQYALTVAEANLTSAEVSREQAARNLSYTEIYSPIDGVVVERNVEIGQTVQASMSAPQLYLLATDLASVEILANVDESDIGSIRNWMPVRFTVSAYPNDTFEGVVRQVRLSSATQENVVNYTAVISVRNEDLRLAPGMTAEVDFIVERAENVFLVPNAALRFRPTEEMIAQLSDSAMIAIARAGGRGGAAGMRAGGGAAGMRAGGGAAGMRGRVGGDSASAAPGAGGLATTGAARGAGPAGGAAGAPNVTASAGRAGDAQGTGAGMRRAGGAGGPGFGGQRGAGAGGGGGVGEGMRARMGGGQGAGRGQGAGPGAGAGAGPDTAQPAFADGAAAAAAARMRAGGGVTTAPATAEPAATAAPRQNDVFVLGGGAPSTGRTRAGVAALWYVKDGKLGVMQVRTGISDGTNTEISAPGLEEGMEIIVGLNQPADEEGNATTNPFQQQRGQFGQGGGFGGPGGGGGGGFGGPGGGGGGGGFGGR